MEAPEGRVTKSAQEAALLAGEVVVVQHAPAWATRDFATRLATVHALLLPQQPPSSHVPAVTLVTDVLVVGLLASGRVRSARQHPSGFCYWCATFPAA